MSKMTILFGLLGIALGKTANAVVVPGNIQFGPATPGNYGATIYQDTMGDYTSVWFDFDRMARTLGVVSWNLDEESDWYLVNEGDLFGPKAIAEGRFPVLFTTDNPRPPISVPSPVFYLGAATGVLAATEQRTVFGWLKVEVTGFIPFRELTYVSSAVAYGAEGIVVGTNMQVAEPGSLGLVLCSVPLVALWRARRLRTRRVPALADSR